MGGKRKVDTKDLVAKIERLTMERMAKEQVVSMRDFRELRTPKSQQTLLIIEDDETMRRALKRIFEDDGFKVISAADGTQLSVVLDDSAIDLIILDVGLPWINGYELAELMKEHPDLKEIPLVFVSGRTSPEDIKRGFSVGADDYIKKPFDVEKIKKSVRTLMTLSE